MLTTLLAVSITAAAPTSDELRSQLPGFQRPAVWFGDNAPSLGDVDMIRGEAFDLSEGTHMLDFWATWCGPCINGFPHVSELDDQYPSINVVGVNVWERSSANGLQERVASFVEDQGERMRFDIAMAPAAGDAWVTAAGQPGIPSCFIVQDGRIIWLGHPNGVDAPLEAIASGSYDMEKSATEAESAVVYEAQKAFIIDVFRAGETERGVALAKLITEEASPYYAGDLVRAVLSRNDVDASQPELSDFAIETLKRAASTEPTFVGLQYDSLAMAYAAIGELDNAIEAQTKALELETDPKLRGWWEYRLAELKGRADAE